MLYDWHTVIYNFFEVIFLMMVESLLFDLVLIAEEFIPDSLAILLNVDVSIYA